MILIISKMENPYINYYCKQAGSGIAGYAGSRYQRGGGFFGKIFKKLTPAIKYIARKGLKAVSSVGRDVLNGENLVESLKDNLTSTGKDIAFDALNKVDE